MAETTFLIASKATGADPDDWSVVSTLLSSISTDITAARALEWDHQPYSSYEKLANGQIKGRGYPIVTWTFAALKTEQRENLRDFVTGVTAEVYIRTPTNETAAAVRTWADYLCIASWVQRPEIIDGIGNVMRVEIKFTHCVVTP